MPILFEPHENLFVTQIYNEICLNNALPSTLQRHDSARLRHDDQAGKAANEVDMTTKMMPKYRQVMSCFLDKKASIVRLKNNKALRFHTLT
jgi:hypothetical protein